MTKILTVRMPPGLLSQADARAVGLGMDRAQYLRHLIEQDLAGTERASPYRFRSEDLAGRFRLGGQSATNERARERLRQGARKTG